MTAESPEAVLVLHQGVQLSISATGPSPILIDLHVCKGANKACAYPTMHTRRWCRVLLPHCGCSYGGHHHIPCPTAASVVCCTRRFGVQLAGPLAHLVHPHNSPTVCQEEQLPRGPAVAFISAPGAPRACGAAGAAPTAAAAAAAQGALDPLPTEQFDAAICGADLGLCMTHRHAVSSVGARRMLRLVSRRGARQLHAGQLKLFLLLRARELAAAIHVVIAAASSFACRR